MTKTKPNNSVQNGNKREKSKTTTTKDNPVNPRRVRHSSNVAARSQIAKKRIMNIMGI